MKLSSRARALGLLLGCACAISCSEHLPAAPSQPPPAAVDMTPAALQVNLATRADRLLDVLAEVVTRDGHPVPGMTLTFAIGHGTVTPRTAQTDSHGLARAIASTSNATTLTVSGGALRTSTPLGGGSVIDTPAAASVSIYATPAQTGMASTFTIATSMDLARADWNFGDHAGGRTSSGTATHVYATAGTYPVSVTVTDVDGRQASGSTSVVVQAAPATPAPAAPSLSATIACAAPAGLDVSCNLAAAYSGALPSNAITSVDWDWGDGTVETVAASPVRTHTYPQSGSFLVTATITATTIDGAKTATASTTVEP